MRLLVLVTAILVAMVACTPQTSTVTRTITAPPPSLSATPSRVPLVTPVVTPAITADPNLILQDFSISGPVNGRVTQATFGTVGNCEVNQGRWVATPNFSIDGTRYQIRVIIERYTGPAKYEVPPSSATLVNLDTQASYVANGTVRAGSSTRGALMALTLPATPTTPAGLIEGVFNCAPLR